MIVRLARVLHWACVAVAIGALIIGVLNSVDTENRVVHAYAAIASVVIAAAVTMLGRSIRYILANE